MDEMSLQQEHNHFYRWSPRGEPTKVRFKRDRGKKVYFFGGLSLKNKTQITHLSKTKKSPDFIQFLENVKTKYQDEIKEKLPQHLINLKKEKEEWEIKSEEERTKLKKQGKEFKYRGLILVVLDGDSTHRSKKTRAWLNNNYGIIELFRLPTYSPDLNPQEWVWKALRKFLAKVEGVYNFEETINRACRYLLTEKFDYQFV